jgi:hypothetical protein
MREKLCGRPGAALQAKPLIYELAFMDSGLAGKARTPE